MYAWQLRVRFETDDGGSTEESWETTHKRQKMPLEVRMFRKGFDRLEDLSERGVGLLAPSKVGFVMAKIKKAVTVAVIGVGLLAGGLAIWWVNSPPGFTLLLFRNPDNHMGRIPPLTRLETYPRLVPWRLTAPAEVDATVLMVNVMTIIESPQSRSSKIPTLGSVILGWLVSFRSVFSGLGLV